MGPPPIQLFLTTIASQITLRQRQEYLLRVLQVNKIPFISYDLASDENAKKLWRRKAPRDKQQLPGILVGGEFPGTFEQFEEAVEFKELDIFLRQKEEWKPFEDDKALLHAEPVGVPGAYSPLQMYPKHAPSRSPSPSPQALKEKEKSMINAGDELADFGLQNVSVSIDELKALVEELGLGGDEANDLAQGLIGNAATKPLPSKVKADAAVKALKKPGSPKQVEKKLKPADTPVDIEPKKADESQPAITVSSAEDGSTKNTGSNQE